MIDGLPLVIATAEDTAISKLEWAKRGGSTRQVEDVAGILCNTGMDPGRLTLEFAESQVMTDDPAIAIRLHGLKGLGVVLAIDGFGSGFSSVRYLGRYPVDVIKIARPVVATMSRTPEDARIVEAIVALGHSLHLQVVAEGIESEDTVFGLENCWG